MSLRCVVLLSLFFALIPPGEGHAQEPDRHGPRWSGSLQLVGLLNRALGIEVERLLADQQTSLVLTGAFRLPVGGSYSGTEWNLGAEARRFVWRRSGTSAQVDGVAVGGAFLLARLDGALVSIHRRDAASLDSLRYAFAVGAGYRFLPGWNVTLTPSLALGLSGHAPTAGLATPNWALRAQFALSAGLVF